MVLEGTTFESNGQILFKNSVVYIDDCTFTSNSGVQGGAINADSSTDLTVTGSEFTGNNATEGGAIYASNLKIHETEFFGNFANLGAAVYITNGSEVLINITNCVFDTNIAFVNYRNIYSESLTRKFNFEYNEYDLDLKILIKDSSYGSDYILEGNFDWGSNLNNTYTLLIGYANDKDIFGELTTIVDNKFSINLGVISGGIYDIVMDGMYTQGDSNDHFFGEDYYNDLYGNEFYLNEPAHAKMVIEKANITLTLDVKNVLIPEIPVLNIYANYDLNFSVFYGNKYYQIKVVNGKGSMQLTDLDLGNYSVVVMREADQNYNLVLNFTSFTISKTYSNFIVLSTNVEYDTLNEAVANSNNDDVIYIKNGTYTNTGIVISNKTLDIIALEGAVFDAQGKDANFIIVDKKSEVYIYGITFRGLHNRNTNYGAIVNHGDLTVDSCNFTNNKITKTSFAQNGGAAIFSDGSSLDIDGCIFINNVAPLKVSTAAVTSLGVEDVSIVDSIFINNSARKGGALYFEKISQFLYAVTSCDFENNTATKGSAIYIGDNSRYLSVTLSNFKKNDIKNNFGENTQLEGGVIYVNSNTTEVTLSIDTSNFEDNSNKDVDGGVILLDGSSNAFIETCIFTNNKGNLGSAILIRNSNNKKTTLVVEDSSFINNNASIGAIVISNKISAVITDCIFTENTGENRHIYNNGFTIVYNSTFDVKDIELNTLNVNYGENSIISGTADIGTNILAVANLTVAGENILVEIDKNNFTYETGILSKGKYIAVLNSISDVNKNTYVMDSVTGIFRVNRAPIELNISVDNITYGETLKVVEKLPSNVKGTVDYQLNGRYYTKEEVESLILDVGKYTLVAVYDNEDFAFSSTIVNFEVYKANPTINVADVDVTYGEIIILNIETNVPSIYTIEVGDYKTIVFINGSRSIEIENTFIPGNYTINVTSQERVNYISNSTKAVLKVNKNIPIFILSLSDKVVGTGDVIINVLAPEDAEGNITYGVLDADNNIVYSITLPCSEDLIIPGLGAGIYDVVGVFEGDDLYYPTEDIELKFINDGLLSNSLSSRQSAIDDTINVNNEDILTFSSSEENLNILKSNGDLLTFSGNDIIADDDEEGRFLYQYDEDDDYSYFDTLEGAVNNAILYGAGIITVRGGVYSVSSMDIEGEIELTIKAYENEVVIFDCEGEDYFMLLTYDTEEELVETPPPPHIEEEQTDGPTVTLENITVRNGVATFGGAIDLEAGTLTLMNCNFYNNRAGSKGGAIYIGKWDAENDATLIAMNTTFINNYAEGEGGAIYIASDNLDGQSTSASFYFCTFLENYQGEDEERVMNYFAGGNVGEIDSKYCVFNGRGEIYDFSIDKINQTVYVRGTSFDPYDSVVLLYADQLPLYTINNYGHNDFNVTFEDVMGGNYTFGVMNDHNFNTYVFGISFELITPNFIISSEEVYENLTDAIDAVGENGIIYANVNYYYENNMQIDIRKSFTLKNFKDDGVTFDGSGALWFFTIAEGCTVQFDGISFADGSIKDHASIENYGNLIINNCTFEGFETDAIIYNSGLINILNSTFSLNFINKALVWNEKDLVIHTVEFSSNIVNVNSVVYNNGAADIVSSNFIDNYNSGNGGAIYNKNSLLINGSVFSENEGYNGGVIYNDGSKLLVINSNFEDNTANGYGGAIFNDGEKADIYDSSFTGGSSEKDGGAIYNNNQMNVDNSTFVGNSAEGQGGAIYNNKTFVLTKSLFGINFADEFSNIYNAGNIHFSENIFDFYDVILIVPDGQYGIPTIITGTLDPQFNMDLQLTLPKFIDGKDANVTISEGVFEYNTGVLPKGNYDIVLDEIIYDASGNVYYGEAISDRLIVSKANVYINLTVEDVILRNPDNKPVLKISVSKNGLLRYLFNNKISEINITDGSVTIELDAVEEGRYSVIAVREGDENYKDAVNTTFFYVKEYEGNFIVNSTQAQFDTLREAIENSTNGDIIYVREGNYTGADNLGLTISGKKLTIIALGDVVFYANGTRLSFLTVDETADVTLSEVTITEFNDVDNVILNKGNLTINEAIIFNNTLDISSYTFIKNLGNLTIVESEFYDNIFKGGLFIYSLDLSKLIINESTFEKNTIRSNYMIILFNVNSAIISSEFSNNKFSDNSQIISVRYSSEVLISSDFYNNTNCADVIYAFSNSILKNSTLLVNNSIFSGNTANNIINTKGNVQNTISESTFMGNTVKNVVYSIDNKLSVIDSIFTDNTLSGDGALNIAKEMNASVKGCVFSNNHADNYRNIYSVVTDLNISNTTFDAKVDFSVYDINYGQNEKINGTIDIGTNLNFTANFDINSKIYSVNVTNNEFTLNTGIIKGGDYNVVLTTDSDNSNDFEFDKIIKTFTVNRIDPGLNVSISDITQGEKLNVTLKINKSATARVTYEINGEVYSKDQLENLTLSHGTYLIKAMYKGDKNFLPTDQLISVKVNKIAPNVTISNVSVSYGDEIKINVTVDVADYYTVFLGNESVTLYVEDNAIFTFSSVEFEPDSYEIKVYVFESDEYAELYTTATLTVKKAVGLFNLSNDITDPGKNATIIVEFPLNAYGNITYRVYDKNNKLVYNITQSCLEDLVVPDLITGIYNVTGTFEGDSYYSNESIINSGEILVTETVELKINVSDITYGENATVVIESNIDGDYLVYVDNEYFVVSVVNGTGNVSVPNLTAGIHIANVTVSDGNYSGVKSTTFEVIKEKINVNIDIETDNCGMASFPVVLPSDAGGNITVYINDELVQIVELVNGSANINLNNFTMGKNNVTVVYSGDNNYVPFNKSFIINRKSSIEAVNMIRGYNSGLDYTAKLFDEYGSPLVNTKVSIKVGTKSYTVKTDSNGVLKLNKKLAVGKYGIVIVNPITGEYKLTNLKIVKRITGNKNRVIYFADKSKYKVRIIGDDGKYVGAGQVVKIRVAGKTYSVVTDKKGYASLKLSLKTKKHYIGVKYKGYFTKNKIIVKSVVKPLKKTVKVKINAKTLKIKVKLKGKRVLKHKKVYLKFKGKTYKKKTNGKGIATFKIPKKVINKLKIGKTYKAAFIYAAKSNGKTIKNIAKCNVKARK